MLKRWISKYVTYWQPTLIQLNLILVMVRWLEGPNLRWWIQQPKENPRSCRAAQNGVLATHQNILSGLIHGSHAIANKRNMQSTIGSHTHCINYKQKTFKIIAVYTLIFLLSTNNVRFPWWVVGLLTRLIKYTTAEDHIINNIAFGY